MCDLRMYAALPTLIVCDALVASYAASTAAMLEKNQWARASRFGTAQAISAWALARESIFVHTMSGYCEPRGSGQDVQSLRGSLPENKHTVGRELAREDAMFIQMACGIAATGSIAAQILADSDAPLGRFADGARDDFVRSALLSALGMGSSVARSHDIPLALHVITQRVGAHVNDIRWCKDLARGGGSSVPMRDPPSAARYVGGDSDASQRSRGVCPSTAYRHEHSGAPARAPRGAGVIETYITSVCLRALTVSVRPSRSKRGAGHGHSRRGTSGRASSVDSTDFARDDYLDESVLGKRTPSELALLFAELSAKRVAADAPEDGRAHSLMPMHGVLGALFGSAHVRGMSAPPSAGPAGTQCVT